MRFTLIDRLRKLEAESPRYMTDAEARHVQGIFDKFYEDQQAALDALAAEDPAAHASAIEAARARRERTAAIGPGPSERGGLTAERREWLARFFAAGDPAPSREDMERLKAARAAARPNFIDADAADDLVN